MGGAALLPTGSSSWAFKYLGEGSALDLQLQEGDFPLRVLDEPGGRNHTSPAGMLQVIHEAKPAKPRDFPAKLPRPLPLLPEPGQAELVLQGQRWNPLAEEGEGWDSREVPRASRLSPQGINTRFELPGFSIRENYGLIPPTVKLSLGLKLKGEREGPLEGAGGSRGRR